MSTDDPLLACRFCMRATGRMRPLPIAQLPTTDIPHLFETVTAIKLDLSDGYSELLCDECEHRLRAAAKTREDFSRVVLQWQEFLYTVHQLKVECDVVLTEVKEEKPKDEPIKAAAAAGDDEDSVVGEHRAVGFNDGDNWADYSSDENSAGMAELPKPSKVVMPVVVVEPVVVAAVGGGKQPAGAKAKPTRARKARKEKKPLEPLTCDICGSRLSTRSILLKHMQAKHMPKSALSADSTTCHICGKTNLKSMVHHMRNHRYANQFKCTHCPKTFCRADMQQQHERTHTGERPFICEVCAFSFTSPTSLKRHMLLRHSAKGKYAHIAQRTHKTQILRTRVVPKIVADDDEAAAAEAIAALPKKSPAPALSCRLECPLCHNSYANRPSLHTHMKIQHGAEGVERWRQYLATVCPVCGMQFADQNGLVEHRVVHQPYQCAICRKRFESKITWEMHVKKHPTKERRYNCSECGALFGCSFTLRMHHRRAHTDYRPFPCTQCDRSFAENAEMMAHMRKRHTFEASLRTFECKLCPAGTPGFKTVDSLRVHMEKHTGRYRYQCKVCMKNQYSGPLLVQHMQSYHAAEWWAEEAEKARSVVGGGDGVGGSSSGDVGGGI